MGDLSGIGYPSPAYHSDFFALRFPISVNRVPTEVRGHGRFAVLHSVEFQMSVSLATVASKIASILTSSDDFDVRIVQCFYDKNAPILSVYLPPQKILDNVKSLLSKKEGLSQLICLALRSIIDAETRNTFSSSLEVDMELFLCSPDNESRINLVTSGNAQFYVDMYKRSLCFEFPSVMEHKSSGRLDIGGNVKFSDLVRELGKAADEWDNLGIHLEVPPYIIQRIQKETSSAIQSLTKLLTWLEGNTKVSWNRVVRALCIVNKRELARTICLKYCVPYPEEKACGSPKVLEVDGAVEHAKLLLRDTAMVASKEVRSDIQEIIEDDFPSLKTRYLEVKKERNALKKRLDFMGRKLHLERKANDVLIEIRTEFIKEEELNGSFHSDSVKELQDRLDLSEEEYKRTKNQIRMLMNDLSQKSSELEKRSSLLRETEEALQKADDEYQATLTCKTEKEQREKARSYSQKKYVKEVKSQIATEEEILIKRKEKVKRIDNILSEKKAKMIDASEKLKNFRSFSYERCRSVDSDGDEVPNLDSFELQIELTKSNIQLADMRSEYALLKLKRISLRNEIERHIRSLKTKRNLLPCFAKSELKGVSFPVHKIEVNCQVDFKVILRDEAGELCGGDHILSARVTSACKQNSEHIFATPSKCHGHYEFTYTPRIPNEFTLDVFVNDHLLNQLSHKLFVMNIPHLPCCSMRGSGAKKAVKNKVASFEVFLADEKDSPINTIQKVTAHCRLLSHSHNGTDCLVLPMHITPHLPSVYSGLYMPSAHGECELTVFVNDMPLSEPMNVSVSNSNLSPLEGAACHGELPFIKLLTSRGGQLNHDAALIEASRNGHLDTITYLLHCGANVNSQNKSMRTALLMAAWHGHADAVSLLVSKGGDVNLKDKRSRSALMFASWQGNISTVKTLIKHKAIIDDQDKDGDSPLHDAARQGNDSVITVLLQNETDVDSKNHSGSTPLMLAASNGHTSAALILIKNGANLSVKDTASRTPLLFAVEHNHSTTVETLIDNGAKVNAEIYQGNNALHIASHATVQKETDKPALSLTVLISKGGEVNAQNNQLQSPLLIASSYGCLAIVHTLIKSGADVNMKDSLSRTAIDCARENDHKEVYEYLQSVHQTTV